MLALFACCAGVYLGLYFNIIALFPFWLLGAGAFITTSISAGQSPLQAASAIIIPSIAVQAGYMLGLTSRGIYAQIRVRLKVGQSRGI